jgi:hypothetical protein
VQHLRRWRGDPVAFVRECLRASPDAWQVEVLRAVGGGVPQQRYALKASKGPGKSTVLAWVVWWWLATRLHPKVVCTSITADNLRDGLWTELAKWQQQSDFLKAAFEWKSERISAVDHPETWWASARPWAKGADASQQANTLAGIHADAVLFIIDEAGGVPDAVAAAAEGGLANADAAEGREAKLLIAGNPTHLEGPLYRACTSERALWWVKEISGDPDDPGRAPRVSVDWAREQIAKYGRENPYVLVNVFGRFPPASASSLFGPDDVSAAMARVIAKAEYASEVKILGVDVARQGDDRTVIALRQGRVVFGPRILRIPDTMAIAGQVSMVFDKHRPDALFIDQATFGFGVLDRLVQLGYPAIGVDFGGKPVTHVKYANRRSEMWFLMAEWVKAGGVLPKVPELTAELTAPKYSFDAHNKLLLEKKKDIKARTGTSPDIADAIALTFAQPVLPRDAREHHRNAAGATAAADYDPLEGA